MLLLSFVLHACNLSCLLFDYNSNNINQQQAMWALLSFAFLLICSVCIQNYQLYKTFPNPNNYNKGVFAENFYMAMVYGDTNSSIETYIGYNWTQLNGSFYNNFYFPLNSIETFSANFGETSLLYTSNDGQIRKRTYINYTGAIDVFIWTINDTLNDLKTAIPSPQLTLYAAICQNSPKVYISDLIVLSVAPEILDYSSNGTVSSIKWRPGTTQLAISGGNSTEERYFELYDTNTKSVEDLVFLSPTRVLDMAFSADGSLVYFINETQVNEQFIYIYDFGKGTTRMLVAPQVAQFL